MLLILYENLLHLHHLNLCSCIIETAFPGDRLAAKCTLFFLYFNKYGFLYKVQGACSTAAFTTLAHFLSIWVARGNTCRRSPSLSLFRYLGLHLAASRSDGREARVPAAAASAFSLAPVAAADK